MTDMVSRYGHGAQVYDPPCLTEGATLYAFVVRADPAKMKASVDAFLNQPAPGVVSFEPVGESVLFFFLRAPSLRSASAAHPSGFVEDFESAPSMPVLMKHVQGGATDYELLNWMPYVLISDPMGCIAGRELFGFLKGLGQFYIPTMPGPTHLFEARAQIFESLDEKSLVEWKPLYRVRRTSGHDRPVEDLFEAADDFLEIVKDLVFDWSPGFFTDIGIDLVQNLVNRTFPVVNLKQLPDVSDPSRASFSQICTAPMKVTKIRGGGRLKGSFEIDVPTYASHDVAGDLGLKGPGPTYPVQMGLYVDLDFTVPAGESVWTSS